MPDEDEVVMQRASRDERVLVCADEGIKLGREMQREDLREDLGDEVDEAYRPVVSETARVHALGQQHEECLDKAAETTAPARAELLEHVDAVLLDDGPTCVQEVSGEAVGAGCFARGQALDGLPNLLGVKRCIKVVEVGRRDEGGEVQSALPGRGGAKQSVKVRVSCRGHVFLVRDDFLVNHQAVHRVLLPPI